MIYSGLGVNWSNVRNDCRYFNNLSHTVHLRQECMYFLFNRTTLLSFSYAYWTVHHLDIWIKVDQLDDTCFIMSIYCSTWVVVQPALGYHITNSQSRYITPTRLESAQYSLHNNTPSRKLLKMDVLTSETCWAVNWRNKASVIKFGLPLFKYQDDVRSNTHKFCVSSEGLAASSMCRRQTASTSSSVRAGGRTVACGVVFHVLPTFTATNVPSARTSWMH